MQTITVHASGSYPIHIGQGLLASAGGFIRAASSAKRAAIVCDDITAALYGEAAAASLAGAGFDSVTFVFKNGEEQKSHETLLALYAFLAEHQFTRRDLLVALGGGVVGDLTGFCAATFLRGMDFAQIPTTLLAQVDSSVGGKTGVNIDAGKNLVGAFKQPVCVVCDTDTLSTLPPEVFADGMAEVIKYGMILDAALFDTLCTGDIHAQLESVVATCVGLKRDVVERDEFDTGERMVLNFGHTLGHAIEQYSHYQGMRHGHAVAIGMSVFTRLAEASGLCRPGLTQALSDCLRRHDLPTETDIPSEALLDTCLRDKKRGGDSIRIILCKDVGESAIVKLPIPDFKAFLLGGTADGR